MEKDKIIIEQLLKQWTSTYERVTQFFDKLSPWAWNKEVAPNRNTMKYLVGHLTAIHDRMIEAMELGNRLYPELDEIYITQPQNNTADYLDYAELRSKWVIVNDYLINHFSSMSIDDWLSKHHYVSAEDFAKEPGRNKLAIFISRYNHIYTHLGQMQLIKES